MRFALALVIVGFLTSLASAQFFAPVVGIKTYEASFGNSGPPRPFFSQTPAINYDIGGSGIGYKVPSPNCTGASCAAGAAAYRVDAVNFKSSTFGAGFPFQLGFNVSPNSYSYTINISQAGPYQITLWTADTSTGGSWNIFLDNVLVTNVPTSNTGDFGTFAPQTSNSFNATLGTHVMKIAWGSGDTQFVGSGDLVAWQGQQAAVVSIRSVAMTCGSNCVFTGGTAGTVGTAQATMSSGSFAGTWSLRTSGTDNFGTQCINYSGGFTINSSTGVLSNGAIANGSYPGVCLVATQAGATGSPFAQAVTITGSGSGSGIPVPGPAQAAGFTTLVFNFDFTDPANANPATWLAADPSSPFDPSCPNPAPPNPKWWMIGIGGQLASVPCSAISIVSDGGSNSVRLHWDTSYVGVTGSTSSTDISTAPYNTNAGVWGSMFAYLEVTMRTDQNGSNDSDGGMFNGVGGPVGGTHVENDVIELFGNNSIHAGDFYWNGGCEPCQFMTNLSGFASFDHTQYHKFGMRVTGDGSSVFWNCMFVDDVAQGCVSSSGSSFLTSGDIAGEPISETLQFLRISSNLSSNNMYVKSVRIWGCGNWLHNGTACTTSNPNP